MINFECTNKYCRDDISLIENYEKAINDKTQTWVIHHRLEIDENKTREQLKTEGRYFNRPACELIFLTKSDHMKLHNHGEKHPLYGKHQSEETRKMKSESMKGKNKDKHHTEETKHKISESLKGEKSPCYGRTWMNNGYDRVYPKTQEEIEHYLELGYQFGKKLK